MIYLEAAKAASVLMDRSRNSVGDKGGFWERWRKGEDLGVDGEIRR